PGMTAAPNAPSTLNGWCHRRLVRPCSKRRFSFHGQASCPWHPSDQLAYEGPPMTMRDARFALVLTCPFLCLTGLHLARVFQTADEVATRERQPLQLAESAPPWLDPPKPPPRPAAVERVKQADPLPAAPVAPGPLAGPIFDTVVS